MTSPAPVSVSIDAVELAQALIRRPSVTPADAGAMRSLAACGAGTTFRLARVLDQSSEFLRYLTQCGLALGTVGAVERNPDGAGLMRIRLGDRGFALAIDAAEKLVVADA